MAPICIFEQSTALSTQPPLTDPAIFSSKVSAIFAPTARGTDLHALTTVAKAICLSYLRRLSGSAMISLIVCLVYVCSLCSSVGYLGELVNQILKAD